MKLKKFTDSLLFCLGSIAAQAIYWFLYSRAGFSGWFSFVAPAVLLVVYALMRRECIRNGIAGNLQLMLSVGVAPLLIGGAMLLIYILSPALQVPVDNMAAQISLPVGFPLVRTATALIFTSAYLSVFALVVGIVDKG